jgi:hypothetical protein
MDLVYVGLNQTGMLHARGQRLVRLAGNGSMNITARSSNRSRCAGCVKGM